MPTRREAVTTGPALIPIAGNFDRKPRSLDRDVTTIGRARGTDLCLEANEISTLHCIIYRAADGYRIRDCNSRCGTRINGESIKSGRLHDADIVNLGPFSFECRLPAAIFPQDKLDPAKIERLKRSRRKLAQLALTMRKRSRGVSSNEEDWSQKTHLLKEKIRVYDQRLRELEEAEEELTNERDQLARAAEGQQQRVQTIEKDLAGQLAQAEAEIHERWQEFQQRCQAEEARVRAALLSAKPAPESAIPVAALAPAQEAESHVVSDEDSQQLRRYLNDLEEQWTRRHDQLQREQEEFTIMKEQWVKAQTKTSSALEDQQSAMSQQESAMRTQKAELTRMMGELRKMQEDLRKQAKGDLRALQDDLDRTKRENAELHSALEEVEQHQLAPANQEDFSNQIEELRGQVKLLHSELEKKEADLHELKHRPQATSGLGSTELAKLRAENELLKKLMEEKNQLLEEMAQANIEAPREPAPLSEAPLIEAPKSSGDLERYESELNDFRRQLEEDRNKLNSECEMLRERNTELDEAIREMEMELSKERAELARERMRLERVREEVKSDMEKLQREASVRETMAPVQKLRDEITGKGKGDKSVNDRLRRMQTQVNDSPTTST